MNRFSTKDHWVTSTSALCAHCSEPIKFRPVTIGKRQMMAEIETEGYFCSYPCLVAYCRERRYFEDDTITYYTNQIFLELCKNVDEYDSVEHINYVRGFRHVATIPGAPPRWNLQKYGGNIDHRAIWELMRKKTKVVPEYKQIRIDLFQ